MPACLSILYTAQASEQPSGWVMPCQSPFSAEKTCDNTFPSMKAQATEQLEHLPVPLAEPCAALRGGVRFAGSQEEQTVLPGKWLKYQPGSNPVPVSRILFSDCFKIQKPTWKRQCNSAFRSVPAVTPFVS